MSEAKDSPNAMIEALIERLANPDLQRQWSEEAESAAAEYTDVTFDRLKARLGEPQSPEEANKFNGLYCACRRAANTEYAASCFDPPEIEVVAEAAQLCGEIEQGDWDGSTESLNHVLADYAERLTRWETTTKVDCCRIHFVRLILEKRRQQPSTPFWSIAKKMMQKRDWGFGRSTTAIKQALKVAEAYGVELGELGPGPPRGKSGPKKKCAD